MPRWQGKSKGTPLGYRIVIFVCTKFGLSPAYFLLRFVSFYYFLFSWSSSRYSYRYFRHQQGYGVIKSRVKVYLNYYIFAQTLLDKMVVMAGIENNFTYDFDGEENLSDIIKGGKGGILLSAHVGNWEAAGHLLRRLNARVNVVMYDGENQNIKEYLEQLTGGRNLNVIIIKDDLSHVYAIGEALQKNELICLHADRFLEGNKTVLKRFLKGEAKFPEGPFALAAAFHVPVSVVFAFKETSSHYHFFGSPLMQRSNEESKQVFIGHLTDSFVNQLEEKIKIYPDQWFNYYNFWE
ncbi:lipid A biosynthesis acyltransferase [soil metagenome]